MNAPTLEPSPEDIPEDIIHDAAEAAQRIFPDYPESSAVHIQGEHADIIFDPHKRGSATREESGMRKQLAKAALAQHEQHKMVADLENRLGASEKENQQRRIEQVHLERAARSGRVDLMTQARHKNLLKPDLEGLIRRSYESGKPLGLMFSDLDYFKAINDQYGHMKGDGLLAIVAEEFFHNIRPEDLLYRFGGDEFVALLPDFHTADDMPPDRYINIRAQTISERIKGKITLFFKENGIDPDKYATGISIGAGIYTPGETADEFLTRVDHYMYAIKRARKS